MSVSGPFDAGFLDLTIKVPTHLHGAGDETARSYSIQSPCRALGLPPPPQAAPICGVLDRPCFKNLMERVQRMKTATSPTRPSALRSTFKPLALLTAVATVTFGIGSAPLIAGAQEAEQRTIATGTGIPLSADAPDRYTVKQGDTLWDIAKVFLRDPWYWPEIWYVNPQVKNPHLIYPGDVLALVSIEGRPQVTVAERGPEGAAAEAEAAPDTAPRGGATKRLSPRVRSTPITAAVTAIPYEAVVKFAGRPGILTKEQVKSGPYIVAVRDSHMIAGEDHEVYARGIADAANGSRYNIVHVDEPLVDPETDRVLAYRGIFVGDSTVTGPGKVAKLVAGVTQREVSLGDKLFAENVDMPMDFIPHPVPEDIRGSVMAVDGIYNAGQYNVVAINRGRRHGIEPGHVMAISQKGVVVRDRYSEGGKSGNLTAAKRVKLPDERVGLLMVFSVHDRLSYGLIMEATHPVTVGDVVSAP